MKYPLFCHSGFDRSPQWTYWFRIFGWGLCITTKPPMFSERMGMRIVLRFGRIGISMVTP